MPAEPIPRDGFISVRGAEEHNLRDIDVDAPRDALTVFTGVSGSGKSSLAFGTIYAEAQRRYFESVTPYARRLLDQQDAPKVRDITGLPPAIALQQRRGGATSRSSVGTVTTLSNSLRMLFSRAGTYPEGAEEVLGLRLVLAQHRDRRLPGVSRPRHRPPHHRGDPRPRSLAEHPRARGRRLAGGVAGPEPPRHPRHPRLRHRPAVAQALAQGPRLDPLHRRAADRRSPSRPRRSRRRLLLQRHLLERRALHPPHAGELAERLDARARAALRGDRAVPGLPRQAVAAGGARGDLRRPRHRRALGAAARHAGRGAAAGRRARGSRARLPLGRLRRADRGGQADRRRPARADRGPARARPRLPRPQPDDDHALARRDAAAAAGDPAALGALRRALRPRRALGRAAPRRRRAADARAAAAAGGGQLAVRGRARHGRRPSGRLDRRRRPGGRRARRRGALQRPGRGPRRGRALDHPPLPLPRAPIPGRSGRRASRRRGCGSGT